jgi:predicted nucleic acid-binding protein
VTVIDTSGVVDYLLGGEAAEAVSVLMAEQGSLAAPELVVFETLAVMRRAVLRGHLRIERAAGAVADLGDLPIELFPSLPLRADAWRLRDKLSIGDGLFVALARDLEEPLVTKDRALAAAARRHAGVEMIEL